MLDISNKQKPGNIYSFNLLISLLLLATNICIVCSTDSHLPLPSVLLPSVFHWDSNNFVHVTPIAPLAEHESANIHLRVQGENKNGIKSELFSETTQAKGSHAFKVSVPRLDFTGLPILNFFIHIRVSGHQSFSTVLAGAADVGQIHLQTDKVFYRPGERVNIRALPLTAMGQLFKGLIQFQLLDPNGFRVFNKTNRANVLLDDASVLLDDDPRATDKFSAGTIGFLAEHFDLPKFLRFGDWRVLAFAIDEHDRTCSSSKFHTIIRVRDYVIPKFYVFMDLEEMAQSPLVVKASVFARFAHGMVVNGDLTLRCSLPRENNSATPSTAGGSYKQHSLPQPAMTKLISTQLNSGFWSGQVDLSGCAGQTPAVISTPKIQVVAEVFERGTFQSGNAIRDWDPFAPAFELIPLRPAFTEKTQKLHILLRVLNSFSYLGEGRAELVSQCISEDKAVNGLNHSLVQRLGTIVELDIDSRCLAYVLRARRRLQDGNYTAVHTLVVPSLRGIHSLDLWMTEFVPLRADYVEGEVLEARVPEGRTLSYAVLCNNGRDLVAADKASGRGARILVPITARMRTGPCAFYTFGRTEATGNLQQQRTIAVDMRLFFVRTRQCPAEQYEMHLSSPNLTVNSDLHVQLKSVPNSLSVLHAYDSRLDGLLKEDTGNAPFNAQLWSLAEFLTPNPEERTVQSFTWFSNTLDLSKIFAKRRQVCKSAGRLTPQCPAPEDDLHRRRVVSASRLSEDCLREMRAECERLKNDRDKADQFLVVETRPQEQQSQRVMTAGSNMFWAMRKPMSSPAEPSRGTQEDPTQTHNQKEVERQEVTVRDFFPEVWLFDDYHVNGTLDIHLKAPHSVTEWNFASKFWSIGRADVCELPKQFVRIQRQVFMDVDIPLHVYENETVQVQVTVTATNLGQSDSPRRMAVCFRGLSPAVCGDVGRDGTFGEIDFTRIELTAQSPLQQKRIFVRFLRSGLHNLSFELRPEEIRIGHDWLCKDDSIQVFDRISKQIRVDKRVDVEEHYRQVVVYRRRKIEPQQKNIGNVPGGDKNGPLLNSTNSPRVHLMESSPDVISYSVRQPVGGQEGEEEGQLRGQAMLPVQTRVAVNAGGRKVFNLAVEFSKFVPSFPPALSTELLSVNSPLGDGLQRVRNRAQLNALAEMGGEEPFGRGRTGRDHSRKKNKGKRKISALSLESSDASSRLLQGYSLPNLLKELAFVTYQLKSLRAALLLSSTEKEPGQDGIDLLLADGLDKEWLLQKEQSLGNLLSELLTFSDCTFSSGHGRQCGFSEYGKPEKPSDRNLLLSTLATSLLCEQRATDEYVCGPVQYLAQSVQSVLSAGGGSGNGQPVDWGLDPYVQFDDPAESQLFMKALMVQTALDCSAYSCSAEAWKNLHSSFYRDIDHSRNYDVRVVAALAYVSTAGTRSVMRAKLAGLTRDDDRAPFWSALAKARSGTGIDLVERSLQKSSEVLVNSLALLAYTQNQSIFRYWRNQFDLEALSDWLVEQQDSSRQYENALDTFFASRALHQYSAVNSQRHVREALMGTLQGNLTVVESPLPKSHQFTDRQLPFLVSIPPTVEHMQLDTVGSARILLGVRVLMEKRRRSRRDPGQPEPVSLRMVQRRTAQGFINQTVALTAHSHLIRSLHIQHGLFTGFTSYPHFVHVLSDSVRYQVEPRISQTAINFVLTNLTKEQEIVYTVTLVEPPGTYSPTNLAPIAISVLHHHFPLGQIIVMSEDLDFGDADTDEDFAPSQMRRRRRRRSISPNGRQLLRTTGNGQQRGGGEEEGIPLVEVDQQGVEEMPPPPAHFQLVNDAPTARSFLTQLDDARAESSSSNSATVLMKAMVEKSRQSPSEIVETVCLGNGVCTCAEMTCTPRCKTCEQLSFGELCQEIYARDRATMRKFGGFTF